MVKLIGRNDTAEELFIHLERYVNVGSPSGFSHINTPSKHTHAKGRAKTFHLGKLTPQHDIICHEFGTAPNFLEDKCTFLHPDMFDDDLFSGFDISLGPEVAPTSSERTVKSVKKNGWFFKLTYKGLIGRVERQIGIPQARSAIEVSKMICSCIDDGGLPDEFMMYPETYARVHELRNRGNRYDWGFVMRESAPRTKSNKVKYVIPAFSLFSPDDKSQTDPLLIEQLYHVSGRDAEDFVFSCLIQPVLKCYFSLLSSCALQLEAHAQNTLFALDKDFRVIGVAFRDAESIDKDVSLAMDLGLGKIFEDNPYKSITRGQYNYQIMHSFMYDFKLGEYLITPVLQAASQALGVSSKRIEAQIKEYAKSQSRHLPNDFFPSDKWFSYANVIHDRTKKRPYIAKDSPKYR